MPLYDQALSSEELCVRRIDLTIHVWRRVRTFVDALSAGELFFARRDGLLWTPGHGFPHFVPASAAKEHDNSFFTLCNQAQGTVYEDTAPIMGKLERLHRLGMLTCGGQPGLRSTGLHYRNKRPYEEFQRAYLEGFVFREHEEPLKQLIRSRGLLVNGDVPRDPITVSRFTDRKSKLREFTWMGLLSAAEREEHSTDPRTIEAVLGFGRTSRQFKIDTTSLINDMIKRTRWVAFYDPEWKRESYLHDVLIEGLERLQR